MKKIEETEVKILTQLYDKTISKLEKIETLFENFQIDSDRRQERYSLLLAYTSWIMSFAAVLAKEVKENDPEMYQVIINEFDNYKPELESLSECTVWKKFFDYGGPNMCYLIYGKFSGYIEALNVYRFKHFANTIEGDITASLEKIESS